ncbi:MAG: hypothetical protein HN842_08305 [Gammaproteobacteria bacterium]|jgi:hypothetical protein|nr:hypothetical protein [Gammaproteobacteria bacterium]
MAKDEKKEEDEGEESSGGGGMLPIILGGLSVLLNIGILVYLILFPSGGDGAMVTEMGNSVRELHADMVPAMSSKIDAIATELLPGDEDEDGDEGEDEDEDEEEDDEEDVSDGDDDDEEYEEDSELSEISMMLTDTQLILRQLAENLNTDTASIKRSVRGASTAGKQVRNMRQDLKRIEKKLDEILGTGTGTGAKKKKRMGSQFPEGDLQEGSITFP